MMLFSLPFSLKYDILYLYIDSADRPDYEHKLYFHNPKNRKEFFMKQFLFHAIPARRRARYSALCVFTVGASLLLSQPVSAASAASALSPSSSSGFHPASIQTFAFSNGPSAKPLQTNDTYSSWQWAYLNDGTFERPVEMNYLEFTEEANLDHSLAEAVPGNGPASRAYINIESVPGMDINLPDAWKVYDESTSEKRDVIVALIDSGVDITHPDLSGSIWVNSDEIPNDGIDNDGNGYIDDVYGWNFIDNTPIIHDSTQLSEESHGTHGAGTIAAARGNETGIAGIADSAHVKIMVLKTVDGSRGIGHYQSIVDAISYAEKNGASICNLSLGTYTDYKEIQNAISKSQMLFVAACGNGDETYNIGYDLEISPVFPASYPQNNIISVASLNFDGNLSNSSNYGAVSVDLAAPGESILSTLPGGRYGMMSGTSMAAPMVTGITALLYSYHTDWNLQDVKNAVLSTTKPLLSLKGKTVTGGIPDAYAALMWQKSDTP